MTPRERIARLEDLLERVQRNREVARKSAPHTSAPPPPSPELEVDMAVAVAPLAPVSEPAPAPAAAAPPSPLPPWQPEPGSAVQPRPASMPPEELSDDDLVEVTTLPPEAEAAEEIPATVVESPPTLSELTLPGEDEPPISSSRTKVAESLDEALASASEAEEEREVPIKTPPPESGPQAAVPLPAGIEAPRAADVEGLEADLSGPASMGPTAEQLGQTIELEAPRGPELEIDVTAGVEEPAPERQPEELEVTLPRAQMPSGTYDLPIAPAVPSPPENAPLVVSASPASPQEPERTARPELGGAEVTRVVLGKPAAPATFVDALDRSLSL